MDQAENFQHKAVEISRKLNGDAHPDLAFRKERLAHILRIKRDFSASEEQYGEALRIQRAKLPEGHPHVAYTLCDFGHLMVQKGDWSQAETLIQECLEIRRKLFAPGHWRIASAESLLGMCRVAQLRFEEAEPLLLRSCAIINDLPGPWPSTKDKTEATQRVIDLYESWDAAEPGKGYAEKAEEWRAKIDKTQKNQNSETPEP